MDLQFSENKLILLYTIHEKENIRATELFDFVLFRGYMDYFVLQSYMAEMIASSLVVQVVQEDIPYFTLLPEGEQVVEMFRSRIPHSIREEIRNYTKNSFLSESPLMAADASIEAVSEERFDVHCRILDYDKVMLELVKSASTEEMANRTRNLWMQKGMNLYMNFLKELN